MTDPNVELLQGHYDAWNQGDLQWVLDHCTPDCEFRTAQILPDTESSYRGHEGIERFWHTWRDPWESLRIEVERIEPVGNDRVLALLRFRGRARDGLEASLEYGHLCTVEGGLASLLIGFSDWDSALEAAGLPG